MTQKSAPEFSFGLTQHSSPLCIAGATHKLSVSMGVRDSAHLSIVFLSLFMHMAPMSAFFTGGLLFPVRRQVVTHTISRLVLPVRNELNKI